MQVNLADMPLGRASAHEARAQSAKRSRLVGAVFASCTNTSERDAGVQRCMMKSPRANGASIERASMHELTRDARSPMFLSWWGWLLVVAALAGTIATSASAQTPPMSIVTGSERSTSIQIGRDLQTLVARPAGLELRPLLSEGSAANVHRLRNEAGVRLGLVQSDVYQAYLDEAKAGNADAQRLSAPLRVVMPLYEEEMYFVVRADSPLNYVHEIEGRRINVGPIGGGTALSASALYRQLFGAEMAAGKISHLANEDALLKLATDNTMDVAIIVTGQPARLFSDMKQEARRYIKLLRLSPDS